MELDLKEALAIVLDLAEQNSLDPDEHKSDGLYDEALRQQAAIEAVRIHTEAQ